MDRLYNELKMNKPESKPKPQNTGIIQLCLTSDEKAQMVEKMKEESKKKRIVSISMDDGRSPSGKPADTQAPQKPSLVINLLDMKPEPQPSRGLISIDNRSNPSRKSSEVVKSRIISVVPDGGPAMNQSSKVSEKKVGIIRLDRNSPARVSIERNPPRGTGLIVIDGTDQSRTPT